MTAQNYDYQPSGETHLFAEEQLVYGTFWSRFAAAFIDGLILIIPNLLLRYLVPEQLSSVLVFLLYFAYEAFLTSGPMEATFGKKAMGLKVVTLDGQRISVGQSIGRYFAKIISAIILFIGYFMMLWDPKRQTLHDKLAGTLVVTR